MPSLENVDDWQMTMNRFVKSIFDLDELEQFARRNQWLNRRHPACKILVTLVYIVAITSINKYALGQVLLFGIYPILMLSIADIPYKSIASKLIIPALLSISLGVVNPLFDREILLMVGHIGISGGVLSLMTLLVKALYTISATLILVSTTTIEGLGRGLAFYRVPRQLIMLLLLMYRYIGVLLNEVSRTMEAYQLRARGSKGIHISSWGSLVGQIMIRSYRRSEDIYNAMLLRGYAPGGR